MPTNHLLANRKTQNRHIHYYSRGEYGGWPYGFDKRLLENSGIPAVIRRIADRVGQDCIGEKWTERKKLQQKKLPEWLCKIAAAV